MNTNSAADGSQLGNVYLYTFLSEPDRRELIFRTYQEIKAGVGTKELFASPVLDSNVSQEVAHLVRESLFIQYGESYWANLPDDAIQFLYNVQKTRLCHAH